MGRFRFSQLAHHCKGLCRLAILPCIIFKPVYCSATVTITLSTEVFQQSNDVFSVHNLVAAKKFITGAGYADWFTTAVRTGDEGSGMTGVSLLLIEKTLPGVTVRRMKTQGYGCWWFAVIVLFRWWMSYTGYIEFEDVRVHKSQLIGAENQGFVPIMSNWPKQQTKPSTIFKCSFVASQFQHGKIWWNCHVCSLCKSLFRRYQRMIARDSVLLFLLDSIKYAKKRKTFGKTLLQHQVIRQKIANMTRRIESMQAWMEAAALQYKQGMHPVQLGSITALMKVEATQMLEFCAREARYSCVALLVLTIEQFQFYPMPL